MQPGNLMHFAAFRNHIGFYPAPSGIAAFKKELCVCDESKGTVRFPPGTPIPLELIRKFRLEGTVRKAMKSKTEPTKTL